MHLAIRRSDEVQSSRPVRALMFSKAPTEVKDSNNLKPIDILNLVESDALRADLEHYLK